MKQQPQNYKHAKMHKKRFFHGVEHRNNKLKFGYYGLKALNSSLLSFKQIEAGRRAINQKLKRSGKIWIRVFPSLSITSKPIEVRMGKGKGNISGWFSYIKPGTILYELNDISVKKAKDALNNAALKLPLKTKIIYKLKVTNKK
jgi:large subunit ribosomal protein L16